MSLTNQTHDESMNTSISHSSFWNILIQRGVQYKSLLPLLCYYMECGQKIEATPLSRNLCLSATSLYFVLLGTPGSGAFKIFHPLLYKKALDTFKIALKLHLIRTSPKKKTSKGGKKSQQNGQPGKRSRAGSTCSGLSDMDWEDSDEEDGYLTPHESQDLTRRLGLVLTALIVMVDHCPLKRSQESLELTITEFVELSHLETGK